MVFLSAFFLLLLPVETSSERVVAHLEHAALDSGESIFRLRWGGARVLKEGRDSVPKFNDSFICIEDHGGDHPFGLWPTCFLGISNQKLLRTSELQKLLPDLESLNSFRKLGMASASRCDTNDSCLSVAFDHDASLQLLQDFKFSAPTESPTASVFETDQIICTKKYRRTRSRGGPSTFAHSRWRCLMSVRN